jgi:hypothetical protein
VSNTARTETHAARRYADKEEKRDRVNEKPTHELEARLAALSSKPTKKHDMDTSRVEVSKKIEPTVRQPTSDSKFDLSRITTHHAEGSTQVKRDRADLLPADRKAQARKRLEERKRLRKNAPA